MSIATSVQVTLQRERELHVSVDEGVAVVDRWHLAIAQPKKRAPLRLVRSSLLDAYNMGREICRSNGLPTDWHPSILPPIVTTVAEEGGRRR